MPDDDDGRESRARETHAAWLAELTGLFTAAGHEDLVVAWIERWVAARPHLTLRRDRAGNLIVTTRRRRALSDPPPLFITAHLDHPAFVVVGRVQ